MNMTTTRKAVPGTGIWYRSSGCYEIIARAHVLTQAWSDAREGVEHHPLPGEPSITNRAA